MWREGDWRKNGGRTWKRKFSVVGVSRWAHSGESSGDGCKMHNSMATKPDMCLLRKETKREKGQETARSDEGVRAEKQEGGRVKEERK